MQKVKYLLLVDDNDKYAKILTEYFQKKSFIIDRAYNGKEALNVLQEKGIHFYDVILTDITMESQLAGLTFLKKARQLGYKGKILIASTGFNYTIAMIFAPLFLKHLNVDYLIPKDSVLNQNIEFYRCEFLSQKEKDVIV